MARNFPRKLSAIHSAIVRQWGGFASLLLIVLFIVLHPSQIEASPSFTLSSDKSQFITPYFEILEDPSGKISIEQILSDTDLVFKKTQSEQFNLGYTHSTFWLKFAVRNDSSLNTWLLTADNPLIEFTAFVQHGDDPTQIKSYIPEVRRSLVSEMQLPENATSTIYLRVFSNSVMDLNFHLMNKYDFEEVMLYRFGFLCAYTGVALALFLYNGFVFLSLKDKNYLYYLIFMFVNVHLNMMSERFPIGIFDVFGWDWWQLVNFYRPMAPLSLFVFTRALFRTRENHPTLDKVLLAYMAGLIALVLSNFFVDQTVIFEIVDPYFLLGIVLSFWTGIASFKRKSAPSVYYILALSAFTAGMGIYLSAMQNLIQINFFTLSSLMIGHGCELVIMSLALASNIKLLQDEVVLLSYQKKIAHYTKLSSLGMMAGGLAHEISNPLAIVMGQIRIAKHLVVSGDKEQLETRIASAYQNCERIEKVIQAVRNLYQGSHLPGDKLFKLEDAVTAITTIFRERIVMEQVHLDVKIVPTTMLKAHPTHIEMVLRILLDNALDALRDVTVKKLAIHQVHTREGLQLCISDSGTGMSEVTRQRVFDPFFTTKGHGQGMGLGLSLAHAIVNSYNWLIDVKSEPGSTRFIITIPMTSVQIES